MPDTFSTKTSWIENSAAIISNYLHHSFETDTELTLPGKFLPTSVISIWYWLQNMRFAIVNSYVRFNYIFTCVKWFSSTYIQGRSSNYRKQLSGDDIYCSMRKMRQKWFVALANLYFQGKSNHAENVNVVIHPIFAQVSKI